LGIFEQGDAWCACGDLAELRAWIIAHLLWDPSRDEHALMKEFLEGYYGPAGPFLQEYIDVNHDLAEKSGVYLKCFTRATEWLGEDDLIRLTEIFRKAEDAVAGDPVLSRRVRKARVSLDYAWIASLKSLTLQAQLRGEPFRGPEDPRAFCRDFVKTLREFGVTHYREGRPSDGLEADILNMFGPAVGPPEGLGVDGKVTVDVQEGQFEIFGEGKWASRGDDPLASDGRAARMAGDHMEWAVQYHPDDCLRGTGSWRVYLVCRYEGQAREGEICQVGLYDEHEEKPVFSKTLQAGEVSGEKYGAVDLGVMELSDDFYFYMAPMNQPDRAKALWVDRFFLVKE